jgi:large subunit ribosomal protein L4
MVLSGKLNDGELIILDDIKLTAAKTKEMAVVVKSLKEKVKKDFDRSALVVLGAEKKDVVRACKNLPKIATISANSINVGALLAKKYLIMTKEAIAAIKKTYGEK